LGFAGPEKRVRSDAVGPSAGSGFSTFLAQHQATMEARVSQESNVSSRIDLNEANEDLIERDLGLAPELSRAIVKYRRAEGRFAALAELLNVPGFNPQLLKSLRPRILI
jgi:DNA uptake protein ComE-like DNA-binding protein